MTDELKECYQKYSNLQHGHASGRQYSPTAHERALEISLNEAMLSVWKNEGTDSSRERWKTENREMFKLFAKAYLQALLDDAETVGEMAKAILKSDTGMYRLAEHDTVRYAKSVIATLKRMGGV